MLPPVGFTSAWSAGLTQPISAQTAASGSRSEIATSVAVDDNHAAPRSSYTRLPVCHIVTIKSIGRMPMKDDNIRRLRANRMWLTEDRCYLEAFRALVERKVDPAD